MRITKDLIGKDEWSIRVDPSQLAINAICNVGTSAHAIMGMLTRILAALETDHLIHQRLDRGSRFRLWRHRFIVRAVMVPVAIMRMARRGRPDRLARTGAGGRVRIMQATPQRRVSGEREESEQVDDPDKH
jgi:hypothetical protein